MISNKTIETVRDRFVELYKPHAIYLFGSYAWGTPHEYSDLDLLVVVDQLTEARHGVIVKGHQAILDLHLGIDLAITTKEEFDLDSSEKAKFFLAQQCAEKSLKGFLAFNQHDPIKIIIWWHL